MNILKLLAFLRGYVTYILKARVKHSLSAGIVRFTQLLRKKIDQRKTYLKGTSTLLKKRCKISVQKLLKKADSSSNLRVLFEDPSKLGRTNVAPSSGMLRLLFGCYPKRSRTTVEAEPKRSRTSLEQFPKKSRSGAEGQPTRSKGITFLGL